MKIQNKIMDCYIQLRQAFLKEHNKGEFNVVIEMSTKKFMELKYELLEEGKCALYEEISDNIVWFIKLCRKKNPNYY